MSGDFDIKAVAFQLQKINESLKKISDSFAPEIDQSVFYKGSACKVQSVDGRFSIKSIAQPDPVRLRELKGIEDIILRLKENTEQFLAGLPCNNVLLYGPRGTGKSSAIKALLNEYGKKGLRMIEMERDALRHLFDVGSIVSNMKEKFVIFCDDLAFEEEEMSYRQLKAMLEGGLEVKPDNMVIYATSNRRHLIPEHAEDNLPVFKGGELHPSETEEEKLSLSDRFGLRLGFYNFDIDTYWTIVRNYISLRKIDINPTMLEQQAVQWSLEHGNFSGRTARQFIDDLEGRLGLRNRQADRRKL
ncbi:MAG TPA: ATP-binding protein [Dissulfurispiraceae bacterium]|nr:ATP-binding protein [Dissulfurispiraceae bacterium]